jgi:hypothetical protein
MTNRITAPVRVTACLLNDENSRAKIQNVHADSSAPYGRYLTS